MGQAKLVHRCLERGSPLFYHHHRTPCNAIYLCKCLLLRKGLNLSKGNDHESKNRRYRETNERIVLQLTKTPVSFLSFFSSINHPSHSPHKIPSPTSHPTKTKASNKSSQSPNQRIHRLFVVLDCPPFHHLAFHQPIQHHRRRCQRTKRSKGEAIEVAAISWMWGAGLGRLVVGRRVLRLGCEGAFLVRRSLLRKSVGREMLCVLLLC